MSIYVAMGMQFFDGPDAWAQGNAQWVKDNTQALAAQTALVAPGTAAERTSWFGAFKVEDDGTLTPVSAWHLDDAGVVRDGLPEAADSPVEPGEPATLPAWEQPVAGVSEPYLIGAEVSHNGQNWRSTHDGQNVWEPGVFGWVAF